MDSFNLIELLKKKPISNPNLDFGINFNDLSVTSNDTATESSNPTGTSASNVNVTITDKTDEKNIKRQMAFKERINQMKINNLLSVKKKTKNS